jgi:hypothetical protein
MHFIESAKASGGKVLINSVQGKSRSVAIAVAWIMKDKKKPLIVALARIYTSTRDCIGDPIQYPTISLPIRYPTYKIYLGSKSWLYSTASSVRTQTEFDGRRLSCVDGKVLPSTSYTTFDQANMKAISMKVAELGQQQKYVQQQDMMVIQAISYRR